MKEVDYPVSSAFAAVFPRKADLPNTARPLQEVSGLRISGQESDDLLPLLVIHEPLGVTQKGRRLNDRHKSGSHKAI